MADPRTELLCNCSKAKTARIIILQQRNHFQIKGFTTTKELWMRAKQFNHPNFFRDRLSNHFHTFSYKQEQSTWQCFVTLRGGLRLGFSCYDDYIVLNNETIT